VLLAVPGLTGCRGVSGSGSIKSETRVVSGFTSVKLAGVGNLTIRQGGQDSLTITTDDNLLPLLQSRVEDGTLILDSPAGTPLKPSSSIDYLVEVKSLAGVSLTGAGNIQLKDVQGRKLAVELSGAGNVDATGQVETLDLQMSGAGNFKGPELAARDVVIHHRGVGNALVNPTSTLDAYVSGVGWVEYLGEPRIQRSVRGLGGVRKH
jgi:hypothetical protein